MAGIRQRSKGTWAIEVFIGRDEEGKRIRVYDTVRGKKADAERRRREILSECDRGVTPTKTHYTVGAWLDKWLQDKTGLKPKTVNRYEGIIRRHLKPNLGHIKLTRLTPAQVQDLETKLLQGKGKGQDEEMEPKGVGLVHGVLNGAMKQAMRLEMVSRNPVALVSPPPVPKEEAYTPEIKHVKALLKLAEEKRHPLWVCIHLITYTGMRRGEALALMWEHIDLDEMNIVVQQALSVPTDGIVIASAKTESSHRTVDLDKRTADILRNHRERQLALAANLGGPPPQKLFPRHYQDEWQHPNTLRQMMKRLSEKVGCPGITTRSLRHFHATVALKATKDVAVVSKRLGHSSPKITLDIYSHVLPGWQREAAEGFADSMESEE